MKQTCSCLYLIVMYSVAGIFSVSSQKSVYDTTEDKFVAPEKSIRELALRLLCNAIDASNSAGALQGSMTSAGDLDRRFSLNGIRCRMRSQPPVGDDNNDDDDNDDEIDVHTRRQVDPLQSCIEAKCSSWNSDEYLNCIYHHCISGFQLGLKSLFLASKRKVRSSVPSPDRHQTSKADDKERHSKALREGSLEKEEEDGQGSGQATATVDSSNSSRGLLQSRLQVMRRGFNDIADVCVQHHCGSFNPHTMNFFNCVESHCAFR